MSSPGQQHHHGVRKNIVEGIGGVIIGAAAVLLLARFFKDRKQAAVPVALPEPAPVTAPKTPARRSRPAAKATAPASGAKAAEAPARKASATNAPATNAPATNAPAKRPRRAKAKTPPPAGTDAS